MKQLKLIVSIIIFTILLLGCSNKKFTSKYKASPMQCYHDNMRILTDMGNLKSALKANCIASAKSSLSSIRLKYDGLQWKKCKSIMIKNQKDIDDLKQLIEKKSHQKNLICRRFEYDIYRPSKNNLKIYY